MQLKSVTALTMIVMKQWMKRYHRLLCGSRYGWLWKSAVEVESCARPPGTVENFDDCDDSDGSMSFQMLKSATGSTTIVMVKPMKQARWDPPCGSLMMIWMAMVLE